MDFSKLKVPELRKELKMRGLNNTGNKNELLERLQSAIKDQKTMKVDCTGETGSDDLEEDLLNEEDDEHLEDCDSVLNELDSTLDAPVDAKESPGTQGVKRKSDGGSTNGTSVKKIVLNRTAIDQDPPKVKEGPNDNEEEASKDGEKKVIKLSVLSAKERLEMRAKKFGMPLSTDAKKIARAERFGTSTAVQPSGNKTVSIKSSQITAAAPASADVLKQRAERFGVKVSTTLTKLENQERLEKRKQRFGGEANGNTTTNTATISTTKSKAQQRLERFKQPVK